MLSGINIVPILEVRKKRRTIIQNNDRFRTSCGFSQKIMKRMCVEPGHSLRNQEFRLESEKYHLGISLLTGEAGPLRTLALERHC